VIASLIASGRSRLRRRAFIQRWMDENDIPKGMAAQPDRLRP